MTRNDDFAALDPALEAPVARSIGSNDGITRVDCGDLTDATRLEMPGEPAGWTATSTSIDRSPAGADFFTRVQNHTLSYVDTAYDPIGDPLTGSGGCLRHTFALTGFGVLVGYPDHVDEPYLPPDPTDNQGNVFPVESKIEIDTDANAVDSNPDAVAVGARRNPTLFGFLNGRDFREKLIDEGREAEFAQAVLDAEFADYDSANLSQIQRQIAEREATEDLISSVGMFALGAAVGVISVPAAVAVEIATALGGAIFGSDEEDPIGYDQGIEIGYERADPVHAHHAVFDVYVSQGSSAPVTVQSSFGDSDRSAKWSLEVDGGQPARPGSPSMEVARIDRAIGGYANEGEPPTPVLDLSRNGENEFLFDASGTLQTNGPVAEYEFTLVEDGANGSTRLGTRTTESPQACYRIDAPGRYEMRLNVTDENGQQSEDTTYHFLVGGEPTARLDGVEDGDPVAAHQTLDLDGSGSTAGERPIQFYEWSVADGDETILSRVTLGPSVSIDPGAVVDEAGEGTYAVTLTVIDDYTGTDSTSVDAFFTEEFEAPSVAVHGADGVDVGEDLTWTVEASSPNGEVTEFDVAADDEAVTAEYEDVGDTYEVHLTAARPGSYDVEVSIADEVGRTAREPVTVDVGAKPPTAVVDFDGDAIGGVARVDDVIRASTHRSVDPADADLSTAWRLERADGERVATGSGRSFTRAISDPGDYELSVTVENEFGESDATTVRFTVIGESPADGVPVPGIQSLPDVEAGETATLEAFSRVVDPEPESYSWRIVHNHADRTTDVGERTGQTVEYTFDRTGQYVVELQGETSDGRTSHEVGLLQVSDPDWADPVALLDVDVNALSVGETVAFDGSDSYDPEGVSDSLEYQWTLQRMDDGTFVDSAGFEPSFTHTFKEPGNYFLSLTVATPDDRTAGFSLRFTAFDGSPADDVPLPGIDGLPDAEAGDSVSLEGSARVVDPEIDEFSWRITPNHPEPTDERVSESGQAVEFTVDDVGEYLVELEATGANGERAFDVATLHVGDPSWADPVPMVDYDEQPNRVGDTVTFDAGDSFDPSPLGEPLEYQWTFQRLDDGTFVDSAGFEPSFTHTFEEPGNYFLSLTVRTADDRTGGFSVRFTVFGDSPADDVPLPGADIPDVTAGETATLEGFARVVDPEIDQYDWRITPNHAPPATPRDDRQGQTVEFTFDHPGEYLVEVEATGANGGRAFELNRLHVSDPAWDDPIAVLDYDERPNRVGDTVTFDAADSHDPAPAPGELDYQWTFQRLDDGAFVDSAGFEPSFSHTFEEPGNYFLSLTVSTPDGRTSGFSVRFTVFGDSPADGVPLPGADLPEVTAGETATLEGFSRVVDPEIDQYDWRIVPNHGEAPNETPDREGRTVEYAFDRPGEYLVEVEATGANGERAFELNRLYVTDSAWADPVATWTSEGSTAQVGDTVTFDATDSHDPAPVPGDLDYQWTFQRTDDGSFVDAAGFEPTFTHTFREAGEYFLALTVSTTDDRTDVRSTSFVVEPDEPELDPVDGTVPQDQDGDGLHEDFNANGDTDLADVVEFFQHRNDPAIQDNVAAYDFREDGDVNLADIVELFQQV